MQQEKYGREELEKLHALGALIGKKPRFLHNIDINLFREHLWDNRQLLPDWNISKFKFNLEKCFEMLSSFTDVDAIPGELAGLLMLQFKLEGYTDNNPNWVEKRLPNVQLDTSIPQRITTSSLYSFCLSSSWRNKSNLETYIDYADDIIDEDAKLTWEAQNIGLIISLGEPTLMSQITIEPEINDKFIEELAKVLVIHATDSSILKSLKDTRTKDYAGAALGYLIKNQRVHRLNVVNLIKDFELVCSSTNLSELEISKWLDGWHNSLRTTIEKNGLKTLETIPESFIRCVVKHKVKRFFEVFRDIFEGTHITTEWWKTQLISPLPWVRIVLEQLNNERILLKTGKLLRDATEWMFSDENQSLKQQTAEPKWVRLLIGLLRKPIHDACIKHLEKVMNEYRTSTSTQREIFRMFGNLVNFKSTNDISTQEVVIAVFDQCPEYMDDQDLNFSVWTSDNLQRFITLLKLHEDDGHIFPKINNNKQIKKAMSKYNIQNTD